MRNKFNKVKNEYLLQSETYVYVENNEIKVRPSESDVYVNNLLKGKVIGFLVENDTTVEIYELNLHKLCVGLKIFLSNNIEYITDDAAYSNNVCVDHIIQNKIKK